MKNSNSGYPSHFRSGHDGVISEDYYASFASQRDTIVKLKNLPISTAGETLPFLQHYQLLKYHSNKAHVYKSVNYYLSFEVISIQSKANLIHGSFVTFSSFNKLLVIIVYLAKTRTPENVDVLGHPNCFQKTNVLGFIRTGLKSGGLTFFEFF